MLAPLHDPLWNAQMLERPEQLCPWGDFEIELPSGHLMKSASLREFVGLQPAQEGARDAHFDTEMLEVILHFPEAERAPASRRPSLLKSDVAELEAREGPSADIHMQAPAHARAAA